MVIIGKINNLFYDITNISIFIASLMPFFNSQKENEHQAPCSAHHCFWFHNNPQFLIYLWQECCNVVPWYCDNCCIYSQFMQHGLHLLLLCFRICITWWHTEEHTQHCPFPPCWYLLKYKRIFIHMTFNYPFVHLFRNKALLYIIC